MRILKLIYPRITLALRKHIGADVRTLGMDWRRAHRIRRQIECRRVRP